MLYVLWNELVDSGYLKKKSVWNVYVLWVLTAILGSLRRVFDFLWRKKRGHSLSRVDAQNTKQEKKRPFVFCVAL
jgi:hypothetical protein